MKSKIINGYKIYGFKNKEKLFEYIHDKKTILIAMNAEKILKNDDKLKQIVNRSVGYTDGIGAVLALKQKGINAKKIAGVEFWLYIINKFNKSKKIYLIGSTTEVIENTAKKLKIEHPKINIIGYRNGYLSNKDKEQLKKDFLLLKPDIIFVAQGSPKQEYLMEELFSEYPALYMGLGGSFDVYTELKKRAPNFFIKLNLEWLYRLLKEPTRIKRQIKLIKFLFLLYLRRL